MPFVLGKGFVDVDFEDRKALAAGRKFKRRMGGIFSGVARAATLAMKVSAGAAVAALTAATLKAAQFEKGMAEVNTLLDVTNEEFDQLKRGVLEVSVAIGANLKDAVRGLYQAISAGIPRENAIDFLRVAGKAAVGGVTSIDVAVDGLTTVLNAYNLEADKASMVSDKLFTTVRLGKTTFPELSSNLGKVAPLAKAAGLSIDEMLAFLASLTKQGLQTDLAVTGLRATLTQLLSPSEELKRELDLLEGTMGVADWRALGFQRTLKLLAAANDNNTEAIAKLFPNVRGLNAILATVGEGAEGAAKDLDELSNSTGAAEEAFQKMDRTTAQSFAKTKAAVNVAMVQLGEQLLPLVNKLIDQINVLTDAGKWAEWGETISSTVGGVIQMISEFHSWLTKSNDALAQTLRIVGKVNIPGMITKAGLKLLGEKPKDFGKAGKRDAERFIKDQEEKSKIRRQRNENRAAAREKRQPRQLFKDPSAKAEDKKRRQQEEKNAKRIGKIDDKVAIQRLKDAKRAEEEAQTILDKWEEFGDQMIPKFEMPFDEDAQQALADKIAKSQSPQFVGLDDIFRQFSTTGESLAKKQLEEMKKQSKLHEKNLEKMDILIEIEDEKEEGAKFQ